MSGDLPPSHVEMVRADKPDDPSRPWGWHCLTCGEMFVGYGWLSLAEFNANIHEAECTEARESAAGSPSSVPVLPGVQRSEQ